MKTRVMVMKIDYHNKTILVATPQKEFISLPLSSNSVHVGQEIEIILPKSNKFSWNKYLGMVAAILLVALVGGASYWAILPDAGVAYIAMDINPSIEMEINHRGQVIEMIPRNEDGEKLLAKIESHQLNLEYAIQLIIREAVEQGYLKANAGAEDNMVVVTLVGDANNNLSLTSLEELYTRQIAACGIESRLVLEETDQETRNKAIREGLSVNQYLLLSKFKKQQGQALETSQLKKLSLKETLRFTKGKKLLPEGKIIYPANVMNGYQGKHQEEKQKGQEKQQENYMQPQDNKQHCEGENQPDNKMNKKCDQAREQEGNNPVKDPDQNSNRTKKADKKNHKLKFESK